MANKIIIGVWKDRLTVNESAKLARFLGERFKGAKWPFLGGIAPAPITITKVLNRLKGSPVQVINQDVHWPASSGSYIGSTSIAMLKELKIKVTMIGHSERRRFFGETNDDIRRKLLGCLDNGIYPILCIGDSETDERVRNEVLTEQLRNVIGQNLTPIIDMSNIVIAYEPVWAISTWRDKRPLPTGQEVGEMLDNVRSLVHKVTNQEPSKCPILFGGSVSPANAYDYFTKANVDGALVGGASLEGESMAAIFEAGLSAWKK